MNNFVLAEITIKLLFVVAVILYFIGKDYIQQGFISGKRILILVLLLFFCVFIFLGIDVVNQ